MKNIFLIFFVFNSFFFFSQNKKNAVIIKPINYYPSEMNGKWYFSNYTDSIDSLTVFYDTIHFCHYQYTPNHYLAVKGKDFVFFNSQLNPILSGKISSFILTESNVFIKWEKDWSRFNFKENTFSSFKADSIKNIEEITYIYSETKVGAIINNVAIPPIYYRLIPFNTANKDLQNPLLLSLEKGKFGLVDYSGKIILQPIASIIHLDDFGIIKYQEDNWKYLFLDGKTVNPLGCEIHLYSKHQYKIYNKERTKGTLYINHKTQLNTLKYDDIFPDTDLNYYTVRQNNKIGLLNNKFELIIPPFCDQLEQLSYMDKLFKYLIGEKWGIIDVTGKIIIKANYHNILEIVKINKEDFYKVALNDQIGIIDKNETIIIPIEYQDLTLRENGFVTQKNSKFGYLDLKANQILEPKFKYYNFTPSKSNNSIITFINENGYTFVNYNAQILLPSTCQDYQYGNDMLKCYYPDRIDVYSIENGLITEKFSYPSIESVEVGIINKYKTYPSGYQNTTLELNQLTGLYAARYKLSGGLKLKPTYTHYQKTFFSNWFYAGMINNVKNDFQFNSFPSLQAYSIFNHLNCSNGYFYTETILSTAIMNQESNSSGSDDEFILIENKLIDWITPQNKDKADPYITKQGLIYEEKLNDNYQKVYFGGEIILCPIEQADMSLMDYFNFLNSSENLWFQDIEQAKLIMNPNLGVSFANSTLKIRDMRDFYRSPFIYEVTNLTESKTWNYYTYQINGEKTLNITTDLSFEKKGLKELISIESTKNQFQEYIIVEKSIENQNKKGIYSIYLNPITDFIYDEIIYAGSQRFLVRMKDTYFYIDENGKKLTP